MSTQKNKFSSNASKQKSKLQFESTHNPKSPNKIKTAATGAVHQQMHQRLSNHEDDNVGLESAHQMEQHSEKVLATAHKINRRRQYKSMSNTSKTSKWQQRRGIKKAYATSKSSGQMTANQNTVQQTKKVFKKVTSATEKIGKFILGNKKTLLSLMGGALILFFVLNTFSSCAQIAISTISSVLSTSYTAEDNDLTDASVAYTLLEAKLDYDITHIEETHSGYDQYRYDIDSIGHDPHELMAYLTVKFEDFTLPEIQSELTSLFDLAYTFTFTEIVEVRYRTETRYDYTFVTDPVSGETQIHWSSYEEEVPYNYYILKVTLVSRPLTSILESRLDEEQYELFLVFMDTKGNRQIFGNPFELDWKPTVTSLYGWRVHPISRNLQIHLGLDLAVSLGTPIHAIHSGIVSLVGYDATGFGYYIVIVDNKGYQSIYAHCSNILVSQGADVLKGQIIAKAGSTGASTGSHLHLEISHNGTRLNPYFYLEDSPATAP